MFNFKKLVDNNEVNYSQTEQENLKHLQTNFFNYYHHLSSFLLILNGSILLFLLTKDFDKYFIAIVIFWANIVLLFPPNLWIISFFHNNLKFASITHIKSFVLFTVIIKILIWVEFILFGAGCIMFELA